MTWDWEEKKSWTCTSKRECKVFCSSKSPITHICVSWKEKAPASEFAIRWSGTTFATFSLKSKVSSRLPFLFMRTPLPSSPKKPQDFDTDLESLSSGDESVKEVLPDTLTAVQQTCLKHPTLEQNIAKLQEKIMALKRKLKETKDSCRIRNLVYRVLKCDVTFPWR